jgi:hypothetical protein
LPLALLRVLRWCRHIEEARSVSRNFPTRKRRLLSRHRKRVSNGVSPEVQARQGRTRKQEALELRQQAS